MQVTLYGGPHDGRRVTISAAVAASRHLRIHNELEPEYASMYADQEPRTRHTGISLYRAEEWVDGPANSRYARTWTKWVFDSTT